MEMTDVSRMAHIKVEDNCENGVNIKNEQLPPPIQGPLPTDHHDIKIENDIDEEILTPSGNTGTNMEMAYISHMAYIKVEENCENEVNIKNEQLPAPLQGPLSTYNYDIKIENDIDEEILLIPSEKIEEENWETYYAGADERDPLKLEEDIADGAIIKFENKETLPKIENYFKEERDELPSNNYSDTKYEIGIDEGIFGATKVNEDKFSRKQSLNMIHTGERPFSCDVCDKSYTEKSHLTRHKRTHTGERPFSCDVCDKSYTESSHLTRHKRTHTGERPFNCDVCDKSYTALSHLTTHKKTHTGERPYSCDICGKSFTLSCTLTTHKKIHTGEKPYSCDICGKLFTKSSNLIAHKKIHTGKRPYSCDVCGKSYTESRVLIRHKKIHTGEKPYRCDDCGMSFIEPGQLTRHKRTHTGEKPYSCDVCGKSFADLSTVKVHKRTHTGEKPYSCNVCGKSFTRSGKLYKHKRTHW